MQAAHVRMATRGFVLSLLSRLFDVISSLLLPNPYLCCARTRSPPFRPCARGAKLREDGEGWWGGPDYCYKMWWLASVHSQLTPEQEQKPGQILLDIYAKMFQSPLWKKHDGRCEHFLYCFTPSSLCRLCLGRLLCTCSCACCIFLRPGNRRTLAS